MLNLLVQLVTLANGLMMNFLAPAVFGLASYGEFIALNAMVFLVHRSLSIISEPLIRFTDARQLIYSTLVLNGCVLLAFTAFHALVPIGSPLLLFGMLLSASVLLALQAMRLRLAYIAFLSLSCVIFTGMLAWSALTDFSLSLVLVMEVSATVPAVIWLVYVLQVSDVCPSGAALVATLRALMRHVPQLLSMTAVMNLFTSALPVFLARTLVPYDLGLFKVMTSVIQSATSLFPVSTQAVLSSFVQHPKGALLYQRLMGWAMLYFACAAMAMIAAAYVLPDLTPYVLLVACLPVYYRAILDERHLTARHRIPLLMVMNLLVAVLTLMVVPFIHTVPHAVLLYASGFTFYAALMLLARRHLWQQLPSLMVVLACPLAVMAMQNGLWIGLFYLALVVVVESLQHRPSRAALRWLWREM